LRRAQLYTTVRNTGLNSSHIHINARMLPTEGERKLILLWFLFFFCDRLYRQYNRYVVGTTKGLTCLAYNSPAKQLLPRVAVITAIIV